MTGAARSAAELRRGYARTPFGQLHFAESGSGTPILMLHQTPRSLDEFAELQPLLATDHRTIAMDMLGFGMSPPAATPQRIEPMAEAALALLDALEIDSAVVLGHHTGAVVAHEIAARAPSRVQSLVLSAVPWVGPERRAKTSVPVDDVETAEDGTHLTALWQLRRPYYPEGRPDLLNRFVRDALAPGVDPVEGHRAVGRYAMELRAPEVRAATLLVVADADPFSRTSVDAVAAALAHTDVQIHRVAAGTIPLMEQCAAEVADVVRAFLAGPGTR